jgi:hypothetical protein
MATADGSGLAPVLGVRLLALLLGPGRGDAQASLEGLGM